MADFRSRMKALVLLLFEHQWLKEREIRFQRIRRMMKCFRRKQNMIKTNILVSIYMYIQVATSPMRPIGRLWIKERNSQWWELIVQETFNETIWTENFRMRKETFIYMCDQLKPVIEQQETQLRKAISVQQRVAITIWCLATSCEYHTIAHLFGVGRSSVCNIVQETCSAIVNVLMNKYIIFPTGNSSKKVIEGFQKKCGFPQCIGAIDGSHIPISAPKMSHTDYYNREGWYSMIIQAIIYHEYIFRDICIEWPGSVHDPRVFINSFISKKITEDHILENEEVQTIEGCQVPVCIVGDSAYPLLPSVTKPFGDSASEQKYFDYRLSSARMVLENAFGRLKGRWRRLLKRIDMAIANVPTVIAACCILHNLCEIHGETFNDYWLQAHATEYEQPPTQHHPTRSDNSSIATPREIRNALTRYFNATN